jgi:probable HAF family extracellular repeat protein
MDNKNKAGKLLRALGGLIALTVVPLSSSAAFAVADKGRADIYMSAMFASGINDAGHVSGRQVRSHPEASTVFMAMVYRDGMFDPIASSQNDGGLMAVGLNNNGQAIGMSPDMDRGYRFDFAGRTTTNVEPLAGHTHTGAFGINDAGEVVGYSFGSFSGGFGRRAIVVRGGVTTELPNLGAPLYSWAFGINQAGQIVGEAGVPQTATQPSAIHAVLWSGNSITDLGTLGGLDSHAHGINDLGHIVGSSLTSSGEEHAFVYINGVMTDLGTLGGPGSYAIDINNRGQIVGLAQRAGDANWYPFLYENGQMIDLLALPEVRAIGCERWTGTKPGNPDGDLPNVALNERGDIAGVCDVGSFTPHLIVISTASAVVRGVPGDLSGEGRVDLVLQNADGRVAAWLMDGTTTTASANLIGAGTGWMVTRVADVNGDGKSDILFTHADGRAYVYLMNGLTVTGGKELLGAGTGWSVTHTADLNGDGRADFLLRHTDGRAHIWLMDGVSLSGSASLLPAGSGWNVVNSGDLNGDGKADLVFMHDDGRGYAYLMDGTTVTAGVGFLSPGSGWTVSHVADLDGDGKSDLVFRHTDGRAHLFLMNGTTFGAGASILGAGTGWSVTHVGDLNGDGKADLVFRHTDGRAHLRLMNGTTVANAGDILPAGSGWQVTQLYDLNGDGKKDLLFRRDDGSITARLMDGLAVLGSRNLVGPGAWSVVPTVQ